MLGNGARPSHLSYSAMETPADLFAMLVSYLCTYGTFGTYEKKNARTMRGATMAMAAMVGNGNVNRSKKGSIPIF
jgi:hypothetical protein